MAGVEPTQQSQLEEQDEELAALQCIFADEITIVTSKESKYNKEVNIKPNNLGMAFSFLITDFYPDIPPTINVTPDTFSLTDNQIEDLLHTMYKVAKDLKGTPMILPLIEEAKDQLDRLDVEYQRHVVDKSDGEQNDGTACSFFQAGKCRFGNKCINLHPGHKTTHDSEGSSEESEVKCHESEVKGHKKEGTSTGKKPPMKTACDVISRIQWDPQLNSNHFIVGYLDRFIGIMEQPFDAFSWVDIATVDLNTLAIPRHRIQYFKYNDEVVWDKRVRLDNVFGSTGSQTTIADIVKKFHKEGLTKEEKEIDNVELDKQKEEKWENKLKKIKQNKNVPNYFIAIRIDDEEIKKNVKMIQDSIISNASGLESACATLGSLHITLCTLRLDTNEEKMRVLKVLRELQCEVSRLLPPSLLVRFQGVDNFYNRILFSPPCREPALMRFINHLQTKLRQAGVNLAGTRETTNPHMTILKMTKSDIESTGIQYLDKSFYCRFFHTYFGVQSVSEIHLCSREDDYRYDGFYQCLASVNLYDEYIQ